MEKQLRIAHLKLFNLQTHSCKTDNSLFFIFFLQDDEEGIWA